MRSFVCPPALKVGDCIGVFTPSSPSYQDNEGLFQNGVANLERMGFRVKLGELTARRASQGYRSGTPQERAAEFMALVRDPEIRGMISTIGGNNSSSMIPYLDFEEIRRHPKVICGYSDVTSLHLAILAYSGLRTFYGPSVMTWFGEWPDGVPESVESFLAATRDHLSGSRKLKPPSRWSHHARRWDNGDWKNIPREWKPNAGWKVLNEGEATADVLVANLNLLCSAAGTSYFPDLTGRVLLIEQMSVSLANDERCLRQLQLMGVFERISGLIVGKPEVLNLQSAPFGYDDLILEVVGIGRPYPIVSEFDCSHTLPMLTLAQLTPIRLTARMGECVSVEVLEPMVEARESP